MAVLPYTGSFFGTRVKTATFIPTPAAIATPVNAIISKTARLDGTALGRLWGPTWPLFGISVAQETTAPTYYDLLKTVTGVVQAGNGASLARTVVVLSQVNNKILGSVVSNASTGAFTIKLSSNESKVTVMMIPLNGDVKNAVIFRDIAPV